MRFVNIKTIILVIFILVLLVVIRNIVFSMLSLRQNSEIVTMLRNQEISEKQRQEFLKQQLHYAKTQEFIENEARDKLGMVKEGEHIILEPARPKPLPIDKTDTTPSWQKWLTLFF